LLPKANTAQSFSPVSGWINKANPKITQPGTDSRPPSVFAICCYENRKRCSAIAEEVWIAATYATAIVFEVVKVVLASDRPVRDALLGEKQES
jgi:hypothetical protein